MVYGLFQDSAEYSSECYVFTAKFQNMTAANTGLITDRNLVSLPGFISIRSTRVKHNE